MNNSKGFDKAVVLIEDHEHGLPGLGRIAYEYIDSSKTLNIFMDYMTNSNKNVPFKILTGEIATLVFGSFLKDKKDVNIITEQIIISKACEAAKKTEEELRSGTREEYCVFARNLVFWAARKHLNYSQARTGAIFNKDHATVLRACKIMEQDDKYFADWQVNVRSEFIRKLKPYIQ